MKINSPNGGSSRDEDETRLPSLPDDVEEDHNLKITLGLPSEKDQSDTQLSYEDEREKLLPELPDINVPIGSVSVSKPSRLKVKKFPLKVGLPLLVFFALIFGYFSLDDDGNSDEQATVQIPRTTKVTPVPSSTITTPVSSTSTVTSSTVITPIVAAEKNIDIEKLMRSVVLIHAFSPNEFPCLFDSTGSGTIVLDGSYILTNYHVIVDDSFSSNPKYCELEVYITESAKELPQFFSTAEVVKTAIDKKHDLAVIKLTEGRLPERAIEIKGNELQIGEEVNLIGYPGMGGFTITYTSGEVSGWENCEIVFDDCDFKGDFYKTSAKMGPGVSGGAGFSSEGEFIGIPTATSLEEIGDNLGLVRPTSYAVQLLEKVKE